MENPGTGGWLPAPIRTERLVLRESEARDRPAFLEMNTSPQVNAYLGGPQSPDEAERLPETPGRRPGVFVVDLGGRMIGTVLLERRIMGPAGRDRPEEVDLGYLFLPEFWGAGYAAEGCSAALDWFAGAFPGERVVLYTQSANEPSMRLAAKLGFTEERRFQKWGAEQWMGVWQA
ncbi:GNAT family N-acetyltransferase [Actinoplanes derwentensis]|uniref:Protein N-acetyltransferase, RimJ/RimL family n=1 Tax=Actinoplanes derwentensis TaxID=113562 RepID=A0A1H1TUA2_9ACTN|nr:GNAT family N-acetyltransferase [Actinoplanes derwentensis]GID85138.1 N-acetyltransferase [Actinoplanes derwentensis]SDS63772.1 Protein N-acetyltransferase, RimJ/RimL family [Actinoplanes derwentensis]